ncbi:MAG: hypothetical protein WCJ64_19845 [Rhodospirillaceae bacterium]
MITEADIQAVRAVCSLSGQHAALAELRQRCPTLSDSSLSLALEYIIAEPAVPAESPAPVTEHVEPHRDSPQVGRRKRLRWF